MSDLAPMTVKVGADIRGLTKGLTDGEAKSAEFANRVQKDMDKAVKGAVPTQQLDDFGDAVEVDDRKFTAFYADLNKKKARAYSKRIGNVGKLVAAELGKGFDSAPEALSQIAGGMSAIGGPLGLAIGLFGTLGSTIAKVLEGVMRDKNWEKIKKQLDSLADGTVDTRHAFEGLRQEILRTGLEGRIEADNLTAMGNNLLQSVGQGGRVGGFQVHLEGQSFEEIVANVERQQQRMRDALNDPNWRRLVNTMGIERSRSGIADSTESLRDQLATINMSTAAAARYNAIHQLMRRTSLTEAEATRELTQALQQQAAAQNALGRQQEMERFFTEARTLILENQNAEARVRDQFHADMVRDEMELIRLRETGADRELIRLRENHNQQIRNIRERNAMLDRGRSLTEQMLNPLERFDARRRELGTLLANNAITPDTFERAMADAFQQLERANAQRNQGPAAMQEGSAAALTAIANWQRQQGETGASRVQQIADTLEQVREEMARQTREARETTAAILRLTVPTVVRVQ